jgi:hypothetical protein
MDFFGKIMDFFGKIMDFFGKIMDFWKNLEFCNLVSQLWQHFKKNYLKNYFCDPMSIIILVLSIVFLKTSIFNFILKWTKIGLKIHCAWTDYFGHIFALP